MSNNGCFQYCSKCKISPNCCESFNNINAPVINKNEIIKIKEYTNLNDFYDLLNNQLYSLKTKDGKCIFYKNNKCSIYNIRPSDCRLFPFDIIKLDNKYYLILYELHCINYKTFKKLSNNIETIVENILPWINEFTDKRNYDKMNNIKYFIIKEIKKES